MGRNVIERCTDINLQLKTIPLIILIHNGDAVNRGVVIVPNADLTIRNVNIINHVIGVTSILTARYVMNIRINYRVRSVPGLVTTLVIAISMTTNLKGTRCVDETAGLIERIRMLKRYPRNRLIK